MSGVRRAVAIAALVLVAGGAGGIIAVSSSGGASPARSLVLTPRASTTSSGPATGQSQPVSHNRTTTAHRPRPVATTTTVPRTIVKAAQAGCPVPPQPPAGPAP